MKLNAAARSRIPKGDFAVPNKAPGSGSYPIPDASHARNALARASGKPVARKVRAAVRRKFPSIGHAAKAAGEHAKAAGMHRMAAAKAKGKGDYTAAAEHHRMAAESHMRAEAAKQKPYPKSAMSAIAGMM